jgi:hypothetical protein
MLVGLYVLALRENLTDHFDSVKRIILIHVLQRYSMVIESDLYSLQVQIG